MDGSGNLKDITAKVWKEFYYGWDPDTLADDTRRAYTRGTGNFNEMDFLEAVGEAECVLDKWQYQDHYVELWYEAKAMHGQFNHYTRDITLRPFGGDPSIPYKWQIAKELERAQQLYGHPIVILYFGDLDPKGLTIPESACRDIRDWCSVEFKFIRAGLNPGDELRYKIQENFDRPGTYQWEALNDSSAGELITRYVSQFVSQGIIIDLEDEEHQITARFQENWREFIGL